MVIVTIKVQFRVRVASTVMERVKVKSYVRVSARIRVRVTGESDYS